MLVCKSICTTAYRIAILTVKVYGVEFLPKNTMCTYNVYCKFLVDATLLVDFTGQRVKVSDLSCAVKLNDGELTERVQFSDDYKVRHALYAAPEVTTHIIVQLIQSFLI